MKLTPVMEKYILHWGEMGARWGTNRSVAQIHALLYLASRPLPAEEIAETLSVARSNVSVSLKELQSWGLVRVTHILGDRRDHFEALHDTWEILTTIVEQRKRREIDPTLTMLRECMIDAENDPQTPRAVKERIAGMLGFMERLAKWYEQVRGLPRTTLVGLMNMGAKVSKVLGKAA